MRHSTPAGRQGRQSVGSILHRMGRVPASGRMPRACMGVHVLSSTTTVVGVGWFSMAMCVVYVDAWSHAMCHARSRPCMCVHAPRAKAGPTLHLDPSRPGDHRLDDSRIRSAVATAHCVPRSQDEVLFTTGLRLCLVPDETAVSDYGLEKVLNTAEAPFTECLSLVAGVKEMRRNLCAATPHQPPSTRLRAGCAGCRLRRHHPSLPAVRTSTQTR